MLMSLAELREQIRAAVLRSASLDDFEDWLVQRSWDMHRWAPPEIQRLVNYLELRFAEHSSGHLDADALLAELAVRLAQLDAPPRPFQISVVGDVEILSPCVSGNSLPAVQRFRLRLSSDSSTTVAAESLSADDSIDLSPQRRAAALTGAVAQ